MVKGTDEMGVRGSTWSSVFSVGAGAPGGVRLPWASKADGRTLKARASNRRRDVTGESGVGGFMVEFGSEFQAFAFQGDTVPRKGAAMLLLPLSFRQPMPMAALMAVPPPEFAPVQALAVPVQSNPVRATSAVAPEHEVAFPPQTNPEPVLLSFRQ